jgi:hypothetical protein
LLAAPQATDASAAQARALIARAKAPELLVFETLKGIEIAALGPPI